MSKNKTRERNKFGMNTNVMARAAADGRRRLVRTLQGSTGVLAGYGVLGLNPWLPESREQAALWANTDEQALAAAQLFVADASMVSLIDAAAPTMPDQPLRATDIPTGPEPGVLWFETPLPDRSDIAPHAPIQALAWQTLPAGHPLLRDGRGASVVLTAWVRTNDFAEAIGNAAPDDAPRLTPFTTVAWEVDTLIGTVHGEVPVDAGSVPLFFQRVAAAFWTLLSQPTVTSSRREQPLSSSDRRRHRRAGVVDPSAGVRVITLATQQRAESGGTGRALVNRHIVRGHWRRQWYASLEEHRHVWIHAFVKGPAGAPLLGGERVFAARGSSRSATVA
ncbi:hypothetical protein EXE58_06050 [Nocardioides seonyuensis]|uniref:Uncharacterized protein n=1 Tax=Nocardioides seonyuensis TaxID=2518371 RepID=A0A4P7IDA9_9ACTN|nr:hypothetical protein [Nocardioides seonyuensis]QBX55058.1 hypothetical protein EXE58_06050 [Nocardioides seonyuensis]